MRHSVLSEPSSLNTTCAIDMSWNAVSKISAGSHHFVLFIVFFMRSPVILKVSVLPQILIVSPSSSWVIRLTGLPLSRVP